MEKLSLKKGNLCISRRQGQSFYIGNQRINIKVTKIVDQQAWFSIRAPKGVQIWREELEEDFVPFKDRPKKVIKKKKKVYKKPTAKTTVKKTEAKK